MKQLEGGLTVDKGYREAVAGQSTSAGRSRSELRADRASPGGWDEDLGKWGDQDFVIPGQGESGAGCGEWFPVSVCGECGHVRMGDRTCGKRSCPFCWGAWAGKAAVRATVRIQSFRQTQPDDHRRQAAHVVASPPEGEVMNERQYWKGRKKAAEIAEEKGFRGFVVVPHPFRIKESVQQEYRQADPDVGIWVWARERYDELGDYAYWSPHYHIIGLTSADMDPAEESDEWTYTFFRSFESYNGVRDRESHEDVYGAIRYLLSHTGFPKGSTKQVITWYGCLANSVFVEDASEEWQYEKPPERVRDRLECEIKDIAGVVEEDDEGAVGVAVDDDGECPIEDCEGRLIDVFDVSVYLRQANPPPDVRNVMEIARDWRLGQIHPPPGLKFPQTEEDARDALAEML